MNEVRKVLVVFGTRPEAIKMCPLVRELQNRSTVFQVRVCVTGQHKEMLQQVLDVFKVVPDYDLAIMQPEQTLADVTSRVMYGVADVINHELPDVVLVHGDTTTSFAASLAAFYNHVPVGHVEAGLRTYDLQSPWPEEFNRQAVDLVSNYFFAPTACAKENLIAEGKDVSKIWVTGNTGIDALAHTVKDGFRHKELEWASGKRLVLITAHRRENLGQPMRNMFRAIRRVLDERHDVCAVYPIHLNPQVRKTASEELEGCDRLRLIDPLDVVSFHNFMARSYLILTDSGGIQEEAPSLGKPVLVMRNTTERPEGIAAGTLSLVGTEEERIYDSFVELLDNTQKYNAMSAASNPYGDGHASERICEALSAIPV